MSLEQIQFCHPETWVEHFCASWRRYLLDELTKPSSNLVSLVICMNGHKSWTPFFLRARQSCWDFLVCCFGEFWWVILVWVTRNDIQRATCCPIMIQWYIQDEDPLCLEGKRVIHCHFATGCHDCLGWKVWILYQIAKQGKFATQFYP